MVRHLASGQSRSTRFLTTTDIGNGTRTKASMEKTFTISLPFVQRTFEVGTGFPSSKALRRASSRKVSNAVSAAHCGSPVEFRFQPCCSDWTRYLRRWSRSCVKRSVDSNLRSWNKPVLSVCPPIPMPRRKRHRLHAGTRPLGQLLTNRPL